MSRPLCNVCPVSSQCLLYRNRPAGLQHLPEPGLERLVFRKCDAVPLTEMARRSFLVVQSGGLKVTDGGEATEVLAAGESLYGAMEMESAATGLRALGAVVEVCLLPTADLSPLLIKPSFLQDLMRVSADRARRARTAVLRTKRVLRERIVLLLSDLAKRYGVRAGDGTRIEMPLTKIDLASLIGAVPESVVRTLGDMVREDLLSFNGKIITIHRPETLFADGPAGAPAAPERDQEL